MAGGKGSETEIDLVPILDAMTAMIFFLVLSGTFMEFNKLTLPPSKTSTITDPVVPPPVSGKLFVLTEGNDLQLVLNWSGVNPDLLKEKVERLPNYSGSLQKAAELLARKFKDLYKEETALQIGLSKDANFQEVISVIDGARKVFPDIVMISYQEDSVIRASLPDVKNR